MRNLSIRRLARRQMLTDARHRADEKLRANGIEPPDPENIDPSWGISSQIQWDMINAEAEDANATRWDRKALRVRRGE
jgi:hypothetical protein